MEFAVLTKSQLQDALTARWGAIAADETLADLIRCEVTARGTCTRWAALRRIEQAASPHVDEELKQRLGELCAALEAEGDVTASSGGLLHTSPLRAVDIQPGELRLITSLPTHRLSVLPGRIEASGVRRMLGFETDRADEVTKSITAQGGIVVSAEAWAGLDLTPCADARWLESLEARLTWKPEAAGSLERDGALDWRGLVIEEARPRWKREGEGGRLWRARTPLGRWVWAWSAESQTPSTGAFVSLNVDDASRTVFALARASDRPVSGVLEEDAHATLLTLREWLPRAEYRYLATYASTVRVAGGQRWSIPASCIDQVFGTLRHRLGLEFTREAPA